MVQRQKQPLWDASYEGMETNGHSVGSSSGVGSGSCICMYELFFHLPAPENKGSEASTNGPLDGYVCLYTLVGASRAEYCILLSGIVELSGLAMR